MIEAVLLGWTDNLKQAAALLEGLHRRALEAGDEGAIPYLLLNRIGLALVTGDWLTAGSLADSCRSYLAQTEAFGFMGATAIATVDAHLGRLQEAKAMAEEALERAMRAGLAPAVQDASSVLGFIALSSGDFEEVHRRLGPVAEMLAAIGLCEPGVLSFIPDEVEALIGLGRLDDAARILAVYEGLPKGSGGLRLSRLPIVAGGSWQRPKVT